MVENSPRKYTRRDFVKIGGLATAGIIAGSAGAYTLLRALSFFDRPAPVVQPPVTNQTTTTTQAPATFEDIIREDLVKRVSKLNEYTDVKLSYPKQMARFVNGPYMGQGNIEFYTADADIHAGIVEKQISLGERGKSGIPLKFSESGFSIQDVYHANLEESLINSRAYTHDLKKAKIDYDSSIAEKDFHKTLRANFDNFDDLSEEVGNEVEDTERFNELAERYAFGITRGLPKPFYKGEVKEAIKDVFEGRLPVPSDEKLNQIVEETKYIRELDKRASAKVLKIKEVGTYGEKLAIADRGYTRGKYHHDLGRPVSVGRLWTRGMTVYEGGATTPDWNPLSTTYGQYGTDGFTAFPLTDRTKSLTGATTEKTTQSWGYFIDDLIPTMLVVGQPVKLVDFGMSRGRAVFYKN